MNETYNQTVNVKDNSLKEKVEEVTKKTFIGGTTGFGISSIGKFGNQVIKPTEQIKKPLTSGSKTYKTEAEAFGSISGATLPELLKKEESNEDDK